MKYPELGIWLPLLAFILDLLFGDPARLPHPICLIGRFYNTLKEPVLAAKKQYLSGALGLCAALAATALAVGLLVNLPGILGLFCAIYFSWSGLALGCLLHEGRKAAMSIAFGSLEDGRAAVGMLVSRDVSSMEQGELYKTLAESLSENFNDAFVAPFFWLVCAGPVGLWVYKAVSTADSMWGYKHEPWGRVGFAAARMDDLQAWLPARLSMLFLYLGAEDRTNWPGRREVIRQARLMESPNAGWSMSTVAWLHSAHMGGQAVYAGKLKDKPRLGPDSGTWDETRILALIGHLARSGLITALAIWGASLIGILCYAYH